MNARWQDTPAAVFLRLLADLMIVNLLSLLCSLGVVTIGASLTAMYTVLFHRQRDEGTVNATKTFFQAFARNFWKATALELVLAALLLVAGVDFWYAASIPKPGSVVFTVVAVAIAFLALVVFVMVFPQLAVYSNSVKNYLKNGFVLFMCAPHVLLLSAAACERRGFTRSILSRTSFTALPAWTSASLWQKRRRRRFLPAPEQNFVVKTQNILQKSLRN